MTTVAMISASTSRETTWSVALSGSAWTTTRWLVGSSTARTRNRSPPDLASVVNGLLSAAAVASCTSMSGTALSFTPRSGAKTVLTAPLSMTPMNTGLGRSLSCELSGGGLSWVPVLPLKPRSATPRGVGRLAS